jgi:hypothetical protein
MPCNVSVKSFRDRMHFRVRENPCGLHGQRRFKQVTNDTYFCHVARDELWSQQTGHMNSSLGHWEILVPLSNGRTI